MINAPLAYGITLTWCVLMLAYTVIRIKPGE